MKVKRWTQLGLGTLLAGSVLASCNQSAEDSKVDSPAKADGAVHLSENAGIGTGGEGEGGVSIAAAASDSTVYNAALAIAEAHALAARDAYALGEIEAAAEMYAHPVSEVLHDMKPILQAQGVADFTQLFTEASAAALAGETPAQLHTRTDRIIRALRAASEKAPDDGRDAQAISTGVAVDQMARAADMYRIALESGRYEPYLDGYGFYKAAEAAFKPIETALKARDARAADTLAETLAMLGKAYPAAGRPEKLDADASRLVAAASRAELAVSNL